MRGRARTTVLALAALAVAGAVWVWLTLPPASIPQPAAVPATHLLGAYHVHTIRSDGSGTVDEVAAAASRAGLDFVVLTDHGDGTRPPLPPARRSGVLILDAVELSTRDGHLVALGLDGPAPYPLGGAARDVMEDIHRMGGLAFVAHPDSPKAELRWRGPAASSDGFEWLNVDSEWRNESPGRLAATLVRALVRPPEAVASLFDGRERPWSTGRRAQVGIAALDAHGAGSREENGQPGGWLGAMSPVPGYESLFRTLAQVAVLSGPPRGNAAEDADAIRNALGRGQSYTVIRAFADPGVLIMTAVEDGRPISMGESLAGGAIAFEAELAGVPDARVTLFDRGRRLADGIGRVTWEGQPDDEAVLWVEGRIGGHDFPWIVSNPIFGRAIRRGPPARDAPVAAGVADALAPDDQWLAEHDPSSQSSHVGGGAELQWRFTLGRETSASPYVALVRAIPHGRGYRDVSFRMQGDRPMRVFVQVRLPGTGDGQRWGRSVFVDQTLRQYVLRLEDFEPIGQTTSLRPVVVEIRSLLFVVDTVNTLPGSSGAVTLVDVALGHGDGEASGGR
ncbi:MAG TPA: hypothetical protein VMM93_00760 [Vicinamibacterales bacterium]|nr:hypothetical protein [Vicinamibacterales bacterium]